MITSFEPTRSYDWQDPRELIVIREMHAYDL
jgi:hypothetical protein